MVLAQEKEKQKESRGTRGVRMNEKVDRVRSWSEEQKGKWAGGSLRGWMPPFVNN